MTPTELRLMQIVYATEVAGREVAKEYERRHGKEISYGTLYVTFRRLIEKGLVTVREGQDEIGSVKYFWLTQKGVDLVNSGAWRAK